MCTVQWIYRNARRNIFKIGGKGTGSEERERNSQRSRKKGGAETENICDVEDLQ